MFSDIVTEFHPKLTPPVLSEGKTHALDLESTLADLPLYNFQADLGCLGIHVAQVFQQYPLLPGVILTRENQFVGMISRQCLLEYLLRPHGIELFLRKPLGVLHSYTQTKNLILAGDTPILLGAQQALRRSPDLLPEPIVLQTQPGVYRLLDIHELNIAYWHIRGIETQVRYERLQVEMLQSDKMASLGRLVDGVAHEILDPVSFIWGNLSHIGDYSRNLLELINAFEKHFPQQPREIQEIKAAIELDYIKEDLPKTLESIKTGAERLSKLANGLQNFCHIDEVYPKPANLHACLDSVLLLLKSRLTSEIQIHKNYGHLPPVPCFVGQISQVFMNILSRAIDLLLNQAISDRLGTELQLPSGQLLTASSTAPQITIATDVCSIEGSRMRWVSIRIGDNGAQMSAETQRQLMDAIQSEAAPTKETSLTTSYRIITAKHGGKFRIYSRINPADEMKLAIGTEFEILLPLA
ncbi:sensor histidine kinase [Phormidesmis priestleyi]